MSDIPNFLDAPQEDEQQPAPPPAPPPPEEDVLAPEAPPPLRDPETEARRQGYSWPEINNHIATGTATALAAGYTPDEVDRFLGRPDPKPLQDRLSANMAMLAAADPQGFVNFPATSLTAEDATAAQRIAGYAGQDAPKVDPFAPEAAPPETLPVFDTPEMRAFYAEALANGEVQAPTDFAARAAASLWNATFQAAPVDAPTREGAGVDAQNAIIRAGRALGSVLPSVQDLTDATIAVADLAGITGPEADNVIKRNLANAWAETGASFYDLAQMAGSDPDIMLQLVQPKPVTEESNPAYALARTAEAMFYGGKTVAEMPVSPTTQALHDLYTAAPGVTTGLLYSGAGATELVMRTVGSVLSGILAGGSQLVDEAMGDREFMGHYIHAGTPEETGQAAAAQLDALMTTLIHTQVSGGAAGLRGTPTRVRDAEGNLVSPRAETAPMATAEAARVVDQVFGDAQKILDAPTEVVDPLKPPGETSSTLPASEAFVPDPLLHAEAENLAKLPDAERETPPETYTLLQRETKVHPVTGEESRLYEIRNESGAVADASVTIHEGGIATVEDIRAPGGENQLGPAAVRQVARQFFEENPTINEIDGFRVSGARPTPDGLVVTRDQIMGRPEPTPVETAELAKGYNAADAIWAHFHNMMIDEAGGVPLSFFRTPERAAYLAEYRAGREISQALVRQFRGEADRFIASNAAKLDEFRATVNRHMPAYESLIRDIQRLGPGNAKLLDGNPIHEMLKFVEGRSLGATMSPKSSLYSVAEMLRHVNMNMRSQIEMTLPDMANFKEDYYRHLWKPRTQNGPIIDSIFGIDRTAAAERPDGVGVQGSGGSLRQRTIPTISEGIEQGLIPQILSPIDNTMHYVAGMAYHLASKKILEQAEASGYIKYTDVPTGWVALDGAGATRLPVSGPNLALRTAEADARRALSDARAVHDTKITGLQKDLADLQAQNASRGALAYARRQIADAITDRFQSTAAERDAVRQTTEAAADAMQAVPLRAMAPPGFAKSYNYWVGKGFYGMPTAGSWISNIQYFSNAMTGMLLGLPGYHFVAIAQESAVNTLANALGAISRGQIGRGLYGIGMATTVVPDLVRQTLRGNELYKRWLDLDDKSEAMQLFTEAGGRLGPRQEIYRYGKSRSLFKSWAEGSLGQELRNDARDILGQPGEAPAVTLGLMGPRLVGIAGREIGRVLNTVTDPLFDRVIPNVKAAATFDALESWLKANLNNPAATPEVKRAMARRIINSVDDRLGEMNQSNLFWPNAFKQAMNLVTVSMGWEYGSLRAAGIAWNNADPSIRGTPPWLSSRFTADRLRWLVSLPLINGLMGSVYQRLKTGAWPDTLFDTQFPRQGGSANRNVAIPGYFDKDFAQWAKLVQIYSREGSIAGMKATGKYLLVDRGNGLKLGLQETLFGEDAIGHKIGAEPQASLQWPFNMDSVYFNLPRQWPQYLSNLLKHIEPIAFQATKGAKADENLNFLDRMLGVRSVASWLQDPDKFFGGRATAEAAAQRAEALRYNRENAQLATPGESATVPAAPSRQGAGGGGAGRQAAAGGADAGLRGTGVTLGRPDTRPVRAGGAGGGGTFTSPVTGQPIAPVQQPGQPSVEQTAAGPTVYRGGGATGGRAPRAARPTTPRAARVRAPVIRRGRRIG